MSMERQADKALGIELQIEELVEQRTRAVVQGRSDDAAQLSRSIVALYDDLAELAEQFSRR